CCTPTPPLFRRLLPSFPTRRSSDLLLSLEGKLAWQDNITWQAHLEAKALNPGLVLADYPGDINATLTSTGSFSEEGLRLVADLRSEEHTSELQSRFDLVCRLLLEKE